MGDVDVASDAGAFPVKIARGPSKTDPVETLLVSPATEWESAKLAACAAAALDPDAHRLLLRGREPAAGETFAHLGVRENQKLLLLETEASKRRRAAEAAAEQAEAARLARQRDFAAARSNAAAEREPPPPRSVASACRETIAAVLADVAAAAERDLAPLEAAVAANSGVAGAFNAARENPRDRAAVPDDLAFAAIADALERALLRLDGAETGGEQALRDLRRGAVKTVQAALARTDDARERARGVRAGEGERR
jgi:hypothetical protein